MPRPKTVDDQVVLEAALELVHTDGPGALTFAAVAAQVELAPSTVVQRFGSKGRLLQAALVHAWEGLERDTAAAADAAGPGASGVVQMLLALTGQYEAHDYADQLLVLREDLRDATLRRRGRAWIRSLEEHIESRLANAHRGAVGLGELVVAQWQGTLTVWSFTRSAPLQSMVHNSLTQLFDRLGFDEGRDSPRGSPGEGG